MGAQKTRDINRLARAALEREEQVREYRVRIRDMGQFQGIRARKLPWRRERRCGSEDSLGNPAIPWGTFPYYAVLRPSYNRITALTIDLQQLGPLPATAQAAKRMQPGNRDAPREIGTGVDIQVDARAERGDGDADSQGVGSVVATVARRCTGREPMSMASAAAATVTVEPSVRWSGTRQRHSLDRCCRRRCRMCRTFQKSLVNRVVRPCVTACPARCLRSRGAGCLQRRHGCRRNAATPGMAEVTTVTGASAVRRSDMIAVRSRRANARRYGSGVLRSEGWGSSEP